MKKVVLIFLIALCQLTIAAHGDKGKLNTKVIAGKVLNKAGETIAGAKLVITETGETVFADMEGSFKFTIATDKNYTVQVNTLGYEPTVIPSQSLNSFSEILLAEL